MSAFAGYVGFAGPAPCGTAARFANSLDGAGLRRARTLEDGSTVFVVRQRILSPEDRFERQPVAGDGLVSLFDGRLDNRGELLDLLGLTSPADDPLPDGELVRRAYLCWREAAPARLLGDFAWALWDAAGRRLMLARDHSLQRSLYFCRVDGGVAFATGYRPLLALPGVSAELDETAVADLLLIAPDESGRSLYKQISWVGAAVRVLITPDGVWEDRLWEPTAQPVLRLKDDRDYAEAARAVFNQAVACRRRVAGPVVAAVSGGLDSSEIGRASCRERV